MVGNWEVEEGAGSKVEDFFKGLKGEVAEVTVIINLESRALDTTGVVRVFCQLASVPCRMAGSHGTNIFVDVLGVTAPNKTEGGSE